MSKLKQVNIFPGRFQPFHKGHLKCCEDAYKENGYPVVIMYVSNKKFDKKKPFDDSLLLKELEIVKKNYDYIEDFIPMGAPLIGRMCDSLKQKGYEANIWLAGPDRIESYRKQLNPKYIDELDIKLPELMETNRYSSATEVREAIKNNDKEKFIELMPKGSEKLYNEYKAQLDKVYECKSSLNKYINGNMKSLIEYINEEFSSNDITTCKSLEKNIKNWYGGMPRTLDKEVVYPIKGGLELRFIPYQGKSRGIKAWSVIICWQRDKKVKSEINVPTFNDKYSWDEMDSIYGEKTMFRLNTKNDFARQYVYGNKKYFTPEELKEFMDEMDNANCLNTIN